MGNMSSNNMPGEGKSGNWRRDWCSFNPRWESSEEVEEEEVESPSGWRNTEVSIGSS